MMTIHIVGGGLAGSEAAYQAAKSGLPVVLYEMRPVKPSPAHKSDKFAELVCSNSLKSNNLDNAAGLLKEEMRILDSLIIEAAEATRVPAGQALAVDREAFSEYVTRRLYSLDNLKIVREEVINPKIEADDIWIFASGPLTSESLLGYLQSLFGQPYLHFFDAAAPLVSRESLDMSKIYAASRYDKGDPDYLNCPMNKEEYLQFWQALVEAKQVELKEFEEEKYFQGCVPIEELAARGQDTLAYGPLKPKGLIDPKTGETPYAVVQLRQDNIAADLYGLVGFQTSLLFPEQKRVFSLIPGLEKAEFLRYGVMHRNTFIQSPILLDEHFRLKTKKNIFFAGQMTGVEGYIESAATGLICGINAARQLKGQEPLSPGQHSMLGALMHYATNCDPKRFQPMNAVFGIMPPLAERVRNKRQRYSMYSKRGIEAIEEYRALLEVK
ncbi:MAG: methylenetetrahydrofolate--tRNA-(uracil(54)-C(5))-methyltransferase (FADH(2)-oxidizing) TrmFO [Firmicutes bacterium]|nr:methylenetetrahydrofolate--tRNA-(uracil(54)-C(5))-methyltransferase (FADH(2)-oxidizing) TrmFO [Bacillota bacterium]